MKNFLRLIFLILLCSNFFATTAMADENRESVNKSAILVKQEPTPTNRPRTPSNSYILCLYSIEYIELEIPIGIEYVDVTIEDDGNIVWFGTLTPNDNIASIPLFDGEYEISCTTNDEQIFYGILNL